MPSYQPVSCRPEEEDAVVDNRAPTENDPLLDDFECIRVDETGDEPKAAPQEPLPTATPASDAPAREAPTDASTSEAKHAKEVSELLIATVSGLQFTFKDGAVTSSSGEPVEFSEELLTVFRAIIPKVTEPTARADTTTARATSPSPLSPEKLAVVRKAKQAEIKAATVKYDTLEFAVDAASSKFADEKAKFNALVEKQEGVEEAQGRVFTTLAAMSTQRAVLRKTRNELYRQLLFFAIPTDEDFATIGGEFLDTTKSIAKLSTEIEKMQAEENLMRIELTLKGIETDLEQQKNKLIVAREKKNKCKQEREDQDIIIKNLEQELAQLNAHVESS